MSDRTGFYERYLARCNAHDFARLGDFVAPDVTVNGSPVGLAGYIAGLEDLAASAPGFHWEIHRLLTDGPWISAHLWTPIGQEFALYRLAGDRIAECWGTGRALPRGAGRAEPRGQSQA